MRCAPVLAAALSLPPRLLAPASYAANCARAAVGSGSAPADALRYGCRAWQHLPSSSKRAWFGATLRQAWARLLSATTDVSLLSTYYASLSKMGARWATRRRWWRRV